MDALEFAKELERMCESYKGCSVCEIHRDGECIGNHFVNMNKLDEIVPIVEKWSKKHPKVTNLDHVAEEMQKIGYEIERDVLRGTCPPHLSNDYISDRCELDENCSSCRKWWDEEYKEKK